MNNKQLSPWVLSFAFASGLIASSALSTVAFAQDARQGSANPGRVGEQIREREQRKIETIPEIEIRETRIAQPPKGAEKINFTLRNVTVDGSSVYSESELATLYQGMIDQEVSLADVYEIAAQLTRQYRNDGYILTQVIVPPQTIDQGEITLRVVEGFIDGLNVIGEGETESALNLIRTYAQQTKSGSVLTAADLERALLLINDLPGISARAILSPAADVTGGANLDVIVARDNFDAEIGVDNYGTRYLGPLQVYGAASSNSFFGNNERITAQTVFGLDNDDTFDELSYLSLSYEQPVFDNGTTFTAFGGYTSTHPGYTLEQFDVRGYARQAYVELEHPVIRSRELNFKARTMFDYNDVVSKDNLIATDTVKDEIRALRFGANVDFLDSLFSPAYNAFDLEYSRGLDVLGATSSNDENSSRPAANTEFNKITLFAQRLQKIYGNFNLMLGFNGQLSDGALLSSEEFGLGGSNFGRGYDSSEVIGDDGYAGTVELQWNNPFKIDEEVDFQVYSFYDAGRVYDDDTTIEALERETLKSTGMGFRSTVAQDLEIEGMVAFPLNKIPQTKNNKDPRFYFSLVKKF